MKHAVQTFVLCTLLLCSAGSLHAASVIEQTMLPPYPDPLGVAAPIAGVHRDTLLVGGGANFPNGFPWENGQKVWHDRLYALTPGATNWVEAGRLPNPLGYAVTLTTDRGIVICGGSDADRHYATCRIMTWNGSSAEFARLPDLPMPVANAAGAVVGSRVIVAGGESAPGVTATLTNIWMLDLAAAQPAWEALPSWPGPGRSLAAAGVQGGRFHLVGGIDLAAGADGKPVRTYLKDGFVLDLETRAWRNMAALPHPVTAAPSPMPAAGSSGLLVLGADDGSRYGFQPVQKHPGFPARVLHYDVTQDRWSERGGLSVCRVTVPSVEWGGRFVIPSGEMRPGVRSPDVRVYRWEESE